MVTGRSNIGKTALIRAIQAGIFGLPGDHYVREGEGHCGVLIQDKNIDLVWRKVTKPTKEKPSALKVNGVTHTKIGKEHGTLTEGLGFRELRTSTARLRPQFAMQHDPIFLLTENETVSAEVFKLLGRTDVVTAAQAAAKRDLKDRENRLKVRREDHGTATTKVAETNHIPALRQALEQTRALVNVAEDTALRKARLTPYLLRLRQLTPRKIPDAPPAPTATKAILRDKLKRWTELTPRTVPPSPEFDSRKAWALNDLTTKLNQFRAARHELAIATRTLALSDEELKLLTQKKHELEHELGICPTCERPFESAA